MNSKMAYFVIFLFLNLVTSCHSVAVPESPSAPVGALSIHVEPNVSPSHSHEDLMTKYTRMSSDELPLNKRFSHYSSFQPSHGMIRNGPTSHINTNTNSNTNTNTNDNNRDPSHPHSQGTNHPMPGPLSGSYYQPYFDFHGLKHSVKNVQYSTDRLEEHATKLENQVNHGSLERFAHIGTETIYELEYSAMELQHVAKRIELHARFCYQLANKFRALHQGGISYPSQAPSFSNLNNPLEPSSMHRSNQHPSEVGPSSPLLSQPNQPISPPIRSQPQPQPPSSSSPEVHGSKDFDFLNQFAEFKPNQGRNELEHDANRNNNNEFEFQGIRNPASISSAVNRPPTPEDIPKILFYADYLPKEVGVVYPSQSKENPIIFCTSERDYMYLKTFVVKIRQYLYDPKEETSCARDLYPMFTGLQKKLSVYKRYIPKNVPLKCVYFAEYSAITRRFSNLSNELYRFYENNFSNFQIHRLEAKRRASVLFEELTKYPFDLRVPEYSYVPPTPPPPPANKNPCPPNTKKCPPPTRADVPSP